MLMAFIRTAFLTRVPPDANPAGRVALYDRAQTEGWLGSHETGAIAPYSAFTGDKGRASWL